MSDRPDRPFSPRPNRRRFVAERVDQPEVSAAPFDDDDDLPLLTEVVDLSVAAPAIAPLPPLFTDADAETIVATVEASLCAQIPALIAAAAATLEEDLKRGLTALVEDSLRDALADYLPEPDFSGDEPEEEIAAAAAQPHPEPAQPAGGDPV